MRYLWLDGLRGVAAAYVVMFHLIGRTNIYAQFGWLSVDLFFVLSGFVLCRSISDSYAGGWRGRNRFVRKRIARLFPMLFLALLLVLVVNFIEFAKELITGDSGTSTAFTPETPLYYALALVLLQFVYPISSTLLIPLWSLSAEFYSNLISLYLGFNTTIRRILYGLISGFLLICLSGFWLDLGVDWSSYRTWIFGFGRAFLGFSIGQIVWKCYTYSFEFTGRFLALLFTITVGTTWATWIFARHFLLISTLIFISLLIFTLAKWPSPDPGNRLHAILKTLGETSYGVYLLHPSLLKLVVPLTNLQGLWLFVVSYIFILFVSSLFTKYLEPVVKSRVLKLLKL